ncbi:hypothetical protein EC988_009588, partial [Linderina pennispora]
KGNGEYTRKKLFLQYLRDHPDVLDEYARLKKQVAAKYGDNREFHLAYNADKTDFIMDVLRKAGWDVDGRKSDYFEHDKT